MNLELTSSAGSRDPLISPLQWWDYVCTPLHPAFVWLLWSDKGLHGKYFSHGAVLPAPKKIYWTEKGFSLFLLVAKLQWKCVLKRECLNTLAGGSNARRRVWGSGAASPILILESRLQGSLSFCALSGWAGNQWLGFADNTVPDNSRTGDH